MKDVVVVTTSYPERAGDAQGHFVAAEVQHLCETASVTVLAPGRARQPLGAERVVGLGGAAAFGFPGALDARRARCEPGRRAIRRRSDGWIVRAGAEPEDAHFSTCGVPIARGRRQRPARIGACSTPACCALAARAGWLGPS